MATPINVRNEIKGYVDDVALHGGMLRIRGWAVDGGGKVPERFAVRLKGNTIYVNHITWQRRKDVQEHLKLDHDSLGFLIEVEAAGVESLNDIGATIEIYCVYGENQLLGPLKLTSKAAKRIVYAKHALISCIFGEKFIRVYPAISGRTCVFFSNNPALESEATSKGWIFRFVKGAPLTQDYRVSSIQSKQIKFLQFLGLFEEFKDIEVFTYFDHKFYVQESHVLWILNNMPSSASVLIRRTGGLKTRISHEIQAAMGQRRYADSMGATIEWLDKMKATKGISEEVRICNTGIIHYQNISTVNPMLQEIYAAVNVLQQPECQILWAAACQPYEKVIHTIDWKNLNPVWKEPPLTMFAA